MSNPFDTGNNPQNPFGPNFNRPQGQNPFQPNPLAAELGSPGMRLSPGVPVRTSALAIVSLILGILALPTFICFPISALLSLGAIITGHSASGSIRRSSGTLSGKPAAVIGLSLGYLMICVGIGLIALLLSTKREPGPLAEPSPEAKALSAAERAITTGSRGIGQGNSEAARRLATEFAQKMEEIDKKAFTNTKAKLKLSGGHYVTWCELREGRCAFVVHVPEYRKFEDDAKKILAQLAWNVAHNIASSELEPDDELAVGLHGIVSYGTVMVGRVSEGDADTGIKNKTHDAGGQLLLPFFRDEHANDVIQIRERDPKQNAAEKEVEKDAAPADPFDQK